MAGMRGFLVLLVHLIVTVARLARPGGVRSVVAEPVLVKHQMLILNRDRKRAPTCAPRIVSSPVCAPSSCALPALFGLPSS